MEEFKKPVILDLKKDKLDQNLAVFETDEENVGLSTNKNSEGKPAESTESCENKTGSDKTLTNAKRDTIELAYLEPLWAADFPDVHSLEVLKNGTLIETIPLREKSYIVFGRNTSCDVQLEHPSISRHHAVLQYRGKDEGTSPIGFYLYDLNSTHGTFLNKKRIAAKGPPEEMEAESDLTVTEIKERAEKQKLIAKGIFDAKMQETKKPSALEQELSRRKNKVSWGIGNEAAESSSSSESDDENAFDFSCLDESKAQQYLTDPKKVLKAFFDRRGYELVIDTIEKGSSRNHQWTCKIELPVDSASGKAVYAEATVSGSKRDAQFQCALEACRMLDAHGILFSSATAKRKRKAKELVENDFYESDEDEFLDRTGELDKKRRQRIDQYSKKTEEVHTFESLTEKLNNIMFEIKQVEQELDLLSKKSARGSLEGPVSGNTGRDSLDNYMAGLSSGCESKESVKVKRSQLRLKLSELQKSAEKYQKLSSIAKPSTSLPPLKKHVDPKKRTVLIGAMKGYKSRNVVQGPKMPAVPTGLPVATSSKEVEEPNDIGNSCAEPSELDMTEEQKESGTSEQSQSEDQVLPDEQIPSPKQLREEPTQYQLTKSSPKRQPSNSLAESESMNIEKGTINRTSGAQDKEDPENATVLSEHEEERRKVTYEDDEYFWNPPNDQTGDGKTRQFKPRYDSATVTTTCSDNGDRLRGIIHDHTTFD